MRESHDVKLPLEVGVCVYGITSHLRLFLEVAKERSLRPIADLHTVGVGPRLVSNLFSEVVHAWVDALVPKAVEDSSRRVLSESDSHQGYRELVHNVINSLLVDTCVIVNVRLVSAAIVQVFHVIVVRCFDIERRDIHDQCAVEGLLLICNEL